MHLIVDPAAPARPARGEALALAGVLALAALAHGVNMLAYPSFAIDDDEGVYVQQAWALLTDGRLAPYTYLYDHAPGGWLLIAGWLRLVGATAASAVDASRVLMLLVHLASLALLWLVARRVGTGRRATLTAALLFAVSPLAVFYERMVLLDVLAAAWALGALALILDRRALLAGLTFGAAILTKETTIVLLPGLALVALGVLTRRDLLRLAGALAAALATYPGLALARGELGTLRAELAWQASRDGGGPFNLRNDFWWYLGTDWLPRDGALVIAGVAAGAACLALLGRRDVRLAGIGLTALAPFATFARGGVVFPYYVALAVPFLTLAIAPALDALLARVAPARRTPLLLACLALLVAGYARGGALAALYTEHPDRAPREALAWITRNVPRDARIVGRDDMWTALHGAGYDGFVSHWRMMIDPTLSHDVLHDDWRSIDYLVVSRDMADDFLGMENALAEEAFAHARLVARWTSEPGVLEVHRQQYVEVWQVDHDTNAGVP